MLILIRQMAALIRRALAEVGTISVLLVLLRCTCNIKNYGTVFFLALMFKINFLSVLVLCSLWILHSLQLLRFYFVVAAVMP